MTPDRIKELRRAYENHTNEADEFIVTAMLEAYVAITGKKHSAKFSDQIAEAVRYERL